MYTSQKHKTILAFMLVLYSITAFSVHNSVQEVFYPITLFS